MNIESVHGYMTMAFAAAKGHQHEQELKDLITQQVCEMYLDADQSTDQSESD